MELNEILYKMEKLVDEQSPNGLYQTGKDRAFKEAFLYELDLNRKSVLACIIETYNDEKSHAKAENKALSSEKYMQHLNKLIKAKLELELAENKHKQRQLEYSLMEKLLSLYQSQMKQR